MAEMTGWPTDGAEGSVSSEARWRAMARLWAPSGVASGLVPTAGAGVINVTAGSAWVDGHYCELTGPASEASTANGLLVVRFTPADNLFELVWRDGVTTPTQTDATWELPIASMTGGVMTDRRSRLSLPQTLIGEVIAPGNISSLVVDGLPQNFRDLVVVLHGSHPAASGQQFRAVTLRFNGDTTTNYRFVSVSTADNATPISTSLIGATGLQIGNFGDDSDLSSARVDIPDYSAGRNLNAIWNGGGSFGSAAGNSQSRTGWGVWVSSAPITRIDAGMSVENWRAGSSMRVYGVG